MEMIENKTRLIRISEYLHAYFRVSDPRRILISPSTSPHTTVHINSTYSAELFFCSFFLFCFGLFFSPFSFTFLFSFSPSFFLCGARSLALCSLSWTSVMVNHLLLLFGESRPLIEGRDHASSYESMRIPLVRGNKIRNAVLLRRNQPSVRATVLSTL
ncbi:hypothetical protein F5Y11DRAFT_169228 [Daldinia sp. FL1419]|nr:hypothetical protein F5Y11DRAFT_169228 [Daldinia sp. FL1419]